MTSISCLRRLTCIVAISSAPFAPPLYQAERTARLRAACQDHIACRGSILGRPLIPRGAASRGMALSSTPVADFLTSSANSLRPLSRPGLSFELSLRTAWYTSSMVISGFCMYLRHARISSSLLTSACSFHRSKAISARVPDEMPPPASKHLPSISGSL